MPGVDVGLGVPPGPIVPPTGAVPVAGGVALLVVPVVVGVFGAVWANAGDTSTAAQAAAIINFAVFIIVSFRIGKETCVRNIAFRRVHDIGFGAGGGSGSGMNSS
jgi:hypothetical protein